MVSQCTKFEVSRFTRYEAMNIGVNSYWAQGLKPPPHFYDHGARMTSPHPHFCGYP